MNLLQMCFDLWVEKFGIRGVARVLGKVRMHCKSDNAQLHLLIATGKTAWALAVKDIWQVLLWLHLRQWLATWRHLPNLILDGALILIYKERGRLVRIT